ncbi:MAG: hypothetical protein J0H34_18015 [Rhizobiales bacterium]|nr:hypothetical protein [Hyphomicrobiales bacterium]
MTTMRASSPKGLLHRLTSGADRIVVRAAARREPDLLGTALCVLAFACTAARAEMLAYGQ